MSHSKKAYVRNQKFADVSRVYWNRMLLLKWFNPIVVLGLDLSNVMYTGCLILWLNGLSRKLWSNAQEMVRPELCTCTYILGNFCFMWNTERCFPIVFDLNEYKMTLNVLWIKPQKGKKQTCNAT